MQGGRLLIPVWVLIASMTVLSAQEAGGGTLTGRIRIQGPQGITVPVPGATVEAFHLESDRRLSALSNESGVFTITAVPPGTYRVEVSLIGLRKEVRESVEISAGATLKLDFDLSIEMPTSSPAAPTRAGTAGKKVPGRPGGGGARPGGVPPALPQGAPAGMPPAGPGPFSGGAPDAFLLPGGVGQVGEFTGAPPGGDLGGGHGFFGGGFGGMFFPGMMVPGGGVPQVNRLRGSIAESFGHSALDARPYPLNVEESPRIPGFRQNWNFSLGGPLVIPRLYKGHNRTSFFVNYAQARDRQDFDLFSTVPTLTERQGYFLQSTIPTGPRASRTPTIYDPATGAPFAGNRIPVDRLDPAAVGLLEFIPEPNLPGPVQNFHLQTHLPMSMDVVSAHLNHNLSKKDNLSFSYLLFSWRGNIIQNLPQFLRQQSVRGQNANLNLTHNFHPKLLAQFMVHFNRNRDSTLNRFAFQRDVAGELGIQGISGDPRDFGVPKIRFTNFTGLDDVIPSLARNQTMRFLANFTWIRDQHTLRWGSEIRLLQLNHLSNPEARGTYHFTGFATSRFDAEGFPLSGTGYDFADFLLGLPQSTSLRFGTPSTYFRSKVLAGFIQDDWKVNKHLTLNLGLRYEYFQPFREKFDHMSNLEVTHGFTDVLAVTPGATGIDGQPVPRGLMEPDFNNFAPRVGFAFRPSQKQSWVFRGGYSIFYHTWRFRTLPLQLANQPPFARTQTLLTSPSQILTLRNGFPILAPETVSNTLAVDRRFRTPYAQTWNFSLQKQLPYKLMMDVSYFGTRGLKQNLLLAPNRALAGSALTTEERRRIENALSFHYETSGGESLMNSLSVMIRRQFSRGLILWGSYRFGKSIDNTSGVGGTAPLPAQDHTNLAAERGLSNFDRRHTLFFNSSYELPFGEGKTFWTQGGWGARLLGNWVVNGFAWVSSGTPLTARVLGNASNNSGTGANFAERADATGTSPDLPRSERTVQRFLNADAFRLPPPGEFGNAGRNTITGPRMFNLNLSLARRFTISKDWGVRGEFRIEATNPFNTPSFTMLNTVVNSNRFGRLEGVGAMRVLNFALRINF